MRPLPDFLLHPVTIFGGAMAAARASTFCSSRSCRLRQEGVSTVRQLEDRRSGGPLFLAIVRLVGPLPGLPSGAPSIRYQSRTSRNSTSLPLHVPSFRLPAPRRDRTAKSMLIEDSVDAPYGLTQQHCSTEASSYTKTLLRMRWIHTHRVSFSLRFW